MEVGSFRCRRISNMVRLMDVDAPRGSDLAILFEQARNGSREAVQKLFATFRVVVRSMVRKHLSQPLRRMYDSEDFVQDVGVKLWTHDLPPAVFASHATLFAYIARMVKNEILEGERRHFVARKRSLNRELPTPMDNFDFERHADSHASADDVALRDVFERWRQTLPPVYQAIVVLRRDGHSRSEIASLLRMSERGVRRVLKKISMTPRPDM
jgi:RNA polymerase sigma factor (sigma-70 family)